VDVRPEPVAGFGHRQPPVVLPPGTDPEQTALALFRRAVREIKPSSRAGIGITARAVRAFELDVVSRQSLVDDIGLGRVANAVQHARVLAVQSQEVPNTTVPTPRRPLPMSPGMSMSGPR
jgi:hypothetical protein